MEYFKKVIQTIKSGGLGYKNLMPMTNKQT